MYSSIKVVWASASFLATRSWHSRTWKVSNSWEKRFPHLKYGCSQIRSTRPLLDAGKTATRESIIFKQPFSSIVSFFLHEGRTVAVGELLALGHLVAGGSHDPPGAKLWGWSSHQPTHHQPAKHPRSNIRLGKEGAEAGEPHWGAQQGGWPKWRWSVLDGHLNFLLLPFYVKIFLLDKVCLVLSIKVSNWPPRALKLLLYVRCILYLGILSEYWPPLVITDHKASIIFNHSSWSLFLHWLTCQLKVNAFICLQ